MCDTDFPINSSRPNQPFFSTKQWDAPFKDRENELFGRPESDSSKAKLQRARRIQCCHRESCQDVAHYEKGVIETPREGKEGDI